VYYFTKNDEKLMQKVKILSDIFKVLKVNWKFHGYNLRLKKKVVIPLHAVEAYGGRGGIAPTHT
jgi:hypothetical protein